MVCGTTSGAGKSFLATALARWYARQGLKVAPFKAQNMSNNARVAAGGEMGSAQYFQALAARAVPDVRMNPVLLKPESDTRSQVILLGQRRDDLSSMEWRARAEHLWPTIRGCLDELLAEPRRGGHRRRRLAGRNQSAVHRYRQHARCRSGERSDADHQRHRSRRRVRASVRHICVAARAAPRAGARLRAQQVSRRCRAAGAGSADARDAHRYPHAGRSAHVARARPAGRGWRVRYPRRWAQAARSPARGTTATRLTAAIVAYPCISNLDEFAPLRQVAGLSLVWAREPAAIAARGSPDPAGLEARGRGPGMAARARARCRDRRTPGGGQADARDLRRPAAAWAATSPIRTASRARRKGLACCRTRRSFSRDKRYRHRSHTLAPLTGFWAPLSGVEFAGYEIRHGETRPTAPAESTPRLRNALPDNAGWQHGQTLVLYPHGLFEGPGAMRALFGRQTPTLDDTLNGLADFIDAHFARHTLSLLPSKRSGGPSRRRP